MPPKKIPKFLGRGYCAVWVHPVTSYLPTTPEEHQMMTIDTALKIGLNPTRYYADHLRTAYDMLSNLTDRQISDLGVQWYAAVGNLEGALRRLYA